jgi:hypothetical protein
MVERYQLEISNKGAALENLNDSRNITSKSQLKRVLG